MPAASTACCERDVRNVDRLSSFGTVTVPPSAGRGMQTTATKTLDPNSMMSEAERQLTTLLIRSINGDRHAYRMFLDKLARHLRTRLRKRLRQQDADIEDLVQEILLAVHKGLDTFRPEVPLTAWISAIVRYKLADHVRSAVRHSALFEPLDEDSDAEAKSQIEALEAQRDLHRLLATLPPRQRGPIEHMKLWGLSVAETAATMGLSESAVKVAVHRGLNTLAAKFQGKSK